MAVTPLDQSKTPWLLLVFSLPASRASQRVEVWRKLQRYGALPLRSSGYLLPNSAANQERLEWLATAIRNYKGEASVVQVQAFDDLPHETLRQQFIEARSREYEALQHDIKTLTSSPKRASVHAVSRLRRRYQEVVAIDFFESPLRSRIEMLLERADRSAGQKAQAAPKVKDGEYQNRTWITRPRPGIDRVSSAWLIRRFIDAKAHFLFGNDPTKHPDAIPFDMFGPEGFGHRGDDCTFETLCKVFAIRDSKTKHIAQIVHDADLGDEKFGRVEGQGLDHVLNGWARLDISDDQLLQRGMDLIEGLYRSLT